ncbi:MAG: DUF554 family protein [Actinobacteria bacterium]|uniref:Unannotated protein n=1 Tax=freshwater metagenome TaxID=449393 RepID=A0A6J5Z4B9_9ZZZZ|nr:DUF554 family protein [Actinomycetota bacterium]
MFIGSGTLINIVTIVLGTALGVTIAHRITDKMRNAVTDGLGLVTGMVAVLTASAITNPVLSQQLGQGRPVLIVLISIVLGGLVGTALQIEERLESFGNRLKHRFAADGQSQFTEGFVAASLLFCVGAMAILGPIKEGLGQGNDIVLLKATLDFFAAIAFASAFGWGVGASMISVGIYQGTFTLLGIFLGNVVSDAQVAILSATGGLLILGISLRLLNIRQVPVGNMLPALVIAPALVSLLS